MISTTFVLFVNHLLAQEKWALSLLKLHANKLANFEVGVFQIKVKVASNGLIESVADVEEIPHVVIKIKPSDLAFIAQNPQKAVSYVKIEGDADFANAISQLSQSLRWDVEDDLSQLIGDVASVRVLAAGKQVVQHAKETNQSIQENCAEYFLEENPMLVRPLEVQSMGDDITKTRDDVERLMKRIDRLEKRRVERTLADSQPGNNKQ